MGKENPQASVASDDNTTLVFVPTVASPTGIPSVSELNAGTKFTYSLTPDGWSPTQSQATIADGRYTLGQALERPGKKTKSLTVKYVAAGDESDVAAELFVEGTPGVVAIRRGVPNLEAFTADHKITPWPILCGEQIEDPAVENGVDTISQTLFVTGVVQTRVLPSSGA